MTEVCRVAREQGMAFAGVLEDKQERARQIKTYYRDVYNLQVELWPPMATSEFFEVAARKCDELSAKHHNDAYVRKLLLAMLDELETHAIWILTTQDVETSEANA